MKKVLLLMLFIIITMPACANSNVKEEKLSQIVQVFKESLIEKDASKLNAIIEDGILDVESALEGNNFFAVDTISQSIDEDEATVVLKASFEELQRNNEYMNFLGQITLTLTYSQKEWVISNIETAIDPSTPRPYYP